MLPLKPASCCKFFDRKRITLGFLSCPHAKQSNEERNLHMLARGVGISKMIGVIILTIKKAGTHKQYGKDWWCYGKSNSTRLEK